MSMRYEWYCAEGIVFDRYEGRMWDDHLMASAAWLSVFNPHAEASEEVSIRFYFTDMEPIDWEPVQVEPRQIRRFALHRPMTIPFNKQYAIRVGSERVVVPQHTFADYRPFEKIPTDMETVVLYPSKGLGEKEKAWYFADTWMGFNDRRSWYETENLNLLNPGDEPAEVVLNFYHVGAADRRMPEQGMSLHISPRRLLNVRLWDLPQLSFKGRIYEGGGQDRTIDFSTWIRSNVPIVPQKIRRCYRQFEETVYGEWTVIGTPCGGMDSEFRGWGG